jgi:hypothetical protein
MPRGLVAFAIAGAALMLAGFTPQATASATSPNWGRQATAVAPPPRAWAEMDFDSRRARTVLYGGSDLNTNFSDTWEWDGNSWSMFNTFPSPPAAIGQGMAFDSARGVSVLLDDSVTWEWDGANWVLRATRSAPSARTWTAMTYDSAHHLIVLFGGQGASGLLGDTWTYDGANWTRRSPANSPSPRQGAALAFDSARGVVVLFGGRAVEGRLNDTWEWDGTNWIQRNPASLPLTRFWNSMAFDSRIGRVIMFGGDRFEPFHALGPINDTWLWDGTSWARDWTANAPSPRAGQSMVYDSAAGTTVLFGGTDEATPGQYSNETWELNPGIVTPAGDPAISVSPRNQGFGFGAPTVGTTTAPADIWVTSSGSGPLVIDSVSTTGDFAVASNDCPTSPDPIAPGSYCRVQVTFTPAACGNRPGSLNFDDNVASGTQSFALRGAGITPDCDGDLELLPPDDITVNATSPSGARVTFQSPRAIDEDNLPPVPTCDHASGSTFPIGTTVVNCQVTDTDDFTPTVTASFRVTVNDTDLALTGVPADISASPSGPSGAVVTYTPPTAVDEDDSAPPVTCDPASGSTFPVGVTTVTCQASDGDDTPSTVSATFRVRVGDADLSLTSVPANIHATAAGAKGFTVYYNGPFAVDEENPAPDVVCDHPSGSIFSVGVTTVTCRATDPDDTPSTVTATFLVTVTDTDLALTRVPAPITVSARLGEPGAVVSYTAPVVSDEDGDSLAATCVPASGSMFPIGTSNVTCWVTDADDTPNTVTAVFPVTVQDTDLTLVNVPADITAVATGPAGATVTYTPPTAVDEDPDPLPVICNPASGSTFPVGAWTVTCQAIDSDDLGSAFAFFHVFVVPDVQLGVSVSPTTASGHTNVTTNVSLTNLGTASERVTLNYSVVYSNSSGGTTTVATDRAIINIAPGASTNRSFSFAVKNNTPKGAYTVVVTANDTTGTVTGYGNFTVV